MPIDYAFARPSPATVVDHEGLIRNCKIDEARFHGARRVENLATGLITETIAVINGNEYQVTVAGDAAATATCSGAFTGALTSDGTNRISWPNGVPKTSGGTSLTVTVAGTLTELTVEDVSGQSNPNPSEYVSNGAGEDHGCGKNVDGVKYFPYENGNTVDANGVVTEAQGAAISGVAYLNEAASTNFFLNSDEPATQTISGLSESYVFWLHGSGSMTLSGGATGIVTEGSPIIADPAGVAVTCTVAGDVTRAQVEAQLAPTSYIPTDGAAVTRAADNLSYTNVNVYQDFVAAIDMTPLIGV